MRLAEINGEKERDEETGRCKEIRRREKMKV